MKLSIFAALSLSLFLFPIHFAHADFKVATVDINRVLNEAPQAKDKRKEFETRADEARKKLEGKRMALQDTKEKLEGAKADPDSKEVQKFRAEVRDFERQAKDADEDIKRDFVKFNRGLADRALKIIADYAKKNQIDLVLDKSDKAHGPILYGHESFDITDQIVKQING